MVAALGALLLAACSRSQAPEVKHAAAPVRLTERVYVLHGPNQEPSPANQGFMNNPGFVLTSKGVVVIDPGSSVQVGEMVLRKIAATTKQPVIAVFNTHVHGDHWLANGAIRKAYPRAVIYAHPNMIARARSEGADWVARMNRLTEGAASGTEAVAPNVGIEHDETLKLGDTHFRILHSGKAHTDGDIMVEIVEEKVLFLGDNVVAERTARMDDGSFRGNIAAVELALRSGARHFVPGHGGSGGREVAETYRAYLESLVGSVRRNYGEGMSDFEMKDNVVADLKAYQGWTMFTTQIGRLISLAYLEVEAEAF